MTEEELLQAYPPPVQALMRHWQHWMHHHYPQLRLQVNPGWRAWAWHHPQAGYVCGFFPEAQGMKWLFEWGSLLHDPQHLLQGQGRRCRHVFLSSEADRTAQVGATQLALWLAEAMALRQNRRAKGP